ncbi:ATP-binding protein [Streptomyces albulus]|nr:ATP-binding protein [Streptomyces noursei]
MLDRWGLAEVSDDALLVLSELLTNAVRHAQVSRGREIRTRYSREPQGVRIVVHDAAQSWPRGGRRCPPSSRTTRPNGSRRSPASPRTTSAGPRSGSARPVTG